MKTLVFSDSHLSDKFDEKKFKYLSSIVNKADQVIINGDFWEGYYISFDKFLNTPWKSLFPLLKSRKTIYLHGNHDKKQFCDDRVSLFSDIQTNKFSLTSGKTTFIFEHGNKISYFFEYRPLNYLLQKALDPLEEVAVNKINRKYYRAVTGQINKLIKRKIKKELKPGEIFVCGHSHCSEIDLAHNFVNSGVNNHGLGQYLLIENGEISQFEESYL